MYQFDPAIAQKHWVNEAIMYQNIVFWCTHNKANEKNYHDWQYRTYNSKKAFIELFPFWTERQIRTILDSLIDQWLIIKWCYNENKYDKTLWYSPSDKNVISIGQKSPMEQTEKSTHYITDNKQDNKQDNLFDLSDDDSVIIEYLWRYSKDPNWQYKLLKDYCKVNWLIKTVVVWKETINRDWDIPLVVNKKEDRIDYSYIHGIILSILAWESWWNKIKNWLQTIYTFITKNKWKLQSK